MSTRAYIGITNEDGSITAIYNHCDGGIKKLGYLLKKFFDTEVKVRELVRHGYISSIKENDEQIDGMEWRNLWTVPECKVYCMPVDYKAETFLKIEDVKNCMICYFYLFETKENKWYYTKGITGKKVKL